MTNVTRTQDYSTVNWSLDAADCLRIDGRQCHVLDQGQGPPVVVLHGLGSIAREIALPLLPLTRRYRLIVPDRPGYGGSTSLRRAGCCRTNRLAGCAACSKIGRQPANHSGTLDRRSGGVGSALCFPNEVAGLVLIAPFCRPTRPAGMPLLRLALLPFVGRSFATGCSRCWRTGLAAIAWPPPSRRTVCPATCAQCRFATL